MNKRILVTGGAGFIGSALIKELQKYQYEIFVFDNLSFGNRDFINIDDDHFFKEDIRDLASVQSVFKQVQPDWLIHLAAIHFIPYCNAHPYESADINIRGTMNILNTAFKTDSIQKAFFASTAAVYPIYDEAIKEDDPVEPLDIYGLTKLTGEHLCREFHLKSGIPTVICRLFNAFGPNETNPHLIPEIQTQINEGKRAINLGNLTPKRDFIHTYDMARAIRMLMEKEDITFDIFNLGRGIEYSVTEIVEAFEQQLNENIQIEVELARVRKTERLHLLADISKLKKATGWTPEWSINEGIKTLIESDRWVAK